MAADVLLRLGCLTDNAMYAEKAAVTLKAFSGNMAAAPISLTQMLVALNFWLGPVQEIVIAVDTDTHTAAEMLRLVRSYFLPTTVVLVHDDSRIERIVPFITSQRAVAGKTVAYMCHNYVCKQPITEVAEFEKAILSFSVLKG